MTDFAVGQVAVGGRHEWVEVLRADGSFIQLIQQFDDIKRSMKNVMGMTFNVKDRDLYTALTPDESMRFTPHDVCWFPDNSGLLVAVVPNTGVLEFRKYDFDGNILYGPSGSLGPAWTNIETDFGWAQEAVKIDLACDSTVVYYTDSHRTVFKYDLLTSTQLPFYQRLASHSGYMYGGVRVLSSKLAHATHSVGLEIGPVVVVAMSLTGNGPRRAITLGNDRSVWTDEVNPPGAFHIFKRHLSDGSEILAIVTKANPVPLNDAALSLACCYSDCVGGVFASTNTIRVQRPPLLR